MDSQSTPASALAFEKAREAIITLKTLKPSLSHDELETLELLLDNEAMETVEKRQIRASGSH